MGIQAFFKKAFGDMKDSAKAQHEVDKANMAAVKAESKAQWEEAKMSPSQRQEKMQAERDAKIAEAKARTEAANARYEAARKKYGEGMLGVGGMDKTALRKDRAAVDAEIERMTRLASMGGFIPCPDHRLMPGTKFELVQYYAEKIKEIKF